MKPTKLQWEDVIQFEEVKNKQLLKDFLDSDRAEVLLKN